MRTETFNALRATLLVLIIVFCVALCMTEVSTPQATPIQATPVEVETEEEPQKADNALLNCAAEIKTLDEVQVIYVDEKPTQTIVEAPAPQEQTPPTEQAAPQTETVDPQEHELLAIAIYVEGGSDSISDDTRLKIGTVIVNRKADPRYPNTIYEVLTEKGQYNTFHWTGVVWPERAGYASEAHAVARAYAIAERILLGERAFEEDVVFQAEFIQGEEVVAHQDGMYFCR